MNWQYKALLQAAISSLPASESMNYQLQRYITRSLPPGPAAFAGKVARAKRHIDMLRQYWGADCVTQASCYEFGAGWTLGGPLAFYALGVDRQVVVDLTRLVKPQLVNHTIGQFGVIACEPALPRLPSVSLPEDNTYADSLRSCYGIDYRAPCDARRSGLAAASVDCITSTLTLEHIPEGDIAKIFLECNRILRPDGVMSHLIDYQDHYSYFDRTISRYNYLRYSDHAWRRYNPSLHYQNRLRHSDYVRLLLAAGFEVIAEDLHRGRDEDLAALRGLPLDERFRQYDAADLSVRSALIILRKRAR